MAFETGATTRPHRHRHAEGWVPGDIFVVANLLRATAAGPSIDTAWFNAFFLVTLTDIPPRLDFWDGVAQVTGLSGGPLLIAGGLALVVSVVSKRLSSEGPHVGPSHSRPPN